MTLWLPVLLWAAVIFALSSIPSLSTDLGVWDLLLRKAAHLIEFAILGALVVRALGRPVTSVLIAVLYAISDELHQHFVPGRNASVVDVLIDVVGVAAGVAAYVRMRA